MSLFDDTPLLLLVLTVVCSFFTLLLFGYRKCLLKSSPQYSLKPFRQDLQILYLVFTIALFFGLSTLLAYQFYDAYKKNAAFTLSKQFSVMTASVQQHAKALNKKKEKDKNNKSPSIPPPPVEESKNSSDNINLIMTVLGVFIALITGITVTIARHSVEDVRLASEEQAKLYRDNVDEIKKTSEKQTELHRKRLAELDIRYNNREIMSLLIQSKISVIADMANAENHDNLTGVSSGSILNEKLKLLNESSHFQETNFSAHKFNECLKRLEMVMENSAYHGILPKFFSHDDLDTFESLLSFFRTPTDRAAQYKYDQAAKVLEPFVHRLGKIVV